MVGMDVAEKASQRGLVTGLLSKIVDADLRKLCMMFSEKWARAARMENGKC